MIIPIYGIYVLSLVCILIVAGFIFGGYKRGFVLKVLDFISTFLCLPIAWFLSSIIGNMMPHLFEIVEFEEGLVIGEMVNQTMNKVIIFVICFVVLRILCFILTPFCKFIDHIPVINTVNEVLGAIVGAFQGLLILLVISYVLCTPAFINGKEVRVKSGLEYLRTTVQSLLWEPKQIQVQEDLQELLNSSNLKDIDMKDWINKSE